MIELIVNDITISFPKDSRIVRDFQSGVFDREMKAYDFTYPVTLPLSQDVKKALNYPDIVANPNLKKEYDAFLAISGGDMIRVTLRLVRTDVKAQTCEVSLLGDYGSYGKLVQDKKLNELEMGGIRVIGQVSTSSTDLQWAFRSGGTNTALFRYFSCDSDQHMNAIADGTIDADYRFPFCVDWKGDYPYINVDFPLPSGQSYISAEKRSLINAYYYINSTTRGYRDPVKEYIQGTYQITSRLTKDRLFWVPMFKVSYLLKRCFEEFGFTVYGDIFNNAAFKEVVLYNTFAINSCYISEQAVTISGGKRYEGRIWHDATKINPKNHVPPMPIIDFLSDVAKLCNLKYDINYSNLTVTVKHMESPVPIGGDIIDLTDKAFPMPVINHEEQVYQNGFEFHFESFEHLGELRGEIKDDVSKYTYRGNVANHTQLGGISSPAAFDIVYVKSENAWYMYSGTQWDFYTYHLLKYTTGTGENKAKISTKITPMPMDKYYQVGLLQDGNYALGTGDPILPLDNVLACSSCVGIEGENLLGITVHTPRDLEGDQYFSATTNTKTLYLVSRKLPRKPTAILNYIGRAKWIAGNDDLVPMGSSTRYNAEGTAVANSVLPWETPSGEGLYFTNWKNFCIALEKSVPVDYKILLDPVTYKNFNPNSKYVMIDSLLFLCEKGEVELPLPSVSKLTLIRI